MLEIITLRSKVASIDCEGMLNMTMDEAWEYSYTTFDAAIKSSVPLSSTRPKFRNIYTNREVLLLRKKDYTVEKALQNTLYLG